MTIPAGCQTVEPCCDTLYTLASDLAHTVGAALTACNCNNCEDLDVFVSHARPVGTGHYVAVWLMRQSYSFQRFGINLASPTFGIRYVEPGFPRITQQGGEVVQPERAALDAAARHSYSHAQTMVNAVRDTVSNARFGGCDSVSIDRIEPDPIAFGFGGWTIEATWGGRR